ncbi:hypothetical protein BGZ93_001752 [Podila epicladia]|nr:hypothetical protein BGZ93_001752 [Podila epicladia]
MNLWMGFKRLLGQQLALLPTKNRSPLEILILATLGCVLAAALKYPNRAFLTIARPDLKARRVDTPQLPLLGNLVQMIRNRHQQLHFIHQLFLEYGDLMSMSILGVGRIHWVNNPKFMEHILKINFDNYVKGDFFRWQLSDILGSGIFVSDGAEWRFHRKTAANIFTTRLYRDLVQGAFKSSAHDLCSVLDRHLGEAVDLQSLFLRLTLDAFGKLTFGIEFNALVTEGPNEFGDAGGHARHEPVVARDGPDPVLAVPADEESNWGAAQMGGTGSPGEKGRDGGGARGKEEGLAGSLHKPSE